MLKQNQTIKIVLTGGGTVGHIKPILIVKSKLEEALKLKNFKTEFIYLGSTNGPESKIIPKNKIKFYGISSGKLRRYFDWQNFIDPAKISLGFLQALSHLIKFKPDVVFAKGGYVTSPVVYAASKLNIPIIIHESDVIMGLANKFAIKYAKKVCLGFPLKYYKDLPIEKIVYTGNPVEVVKKNKTKKKNKKPKILIMGGSQGSRFINQAFASIMEDLTKSYQVTHICGKDDYEWMQKNKWKNYKLYDFTDKIASLIYDADLVVSRAGANSLAEISAAEKPSIIIPLSSAANDHQRANAEVYAKANAAIVLTENKINPKSLLSLIDNILQDKETMQLMSLSTKNLSNPNSSSQIAKAILKTINL